MQQEILKRWIYGMFFYKDILPFHIPAGTSIFLADLYDDIVRDYNAGIGMEDVNIQDKITAFNKLLNNSSIKTIQ